MQKYLSVQLETLAFLLQIFYLTLEFESELLYVLLPFFFEFLELIVILHGGLVKIPGLHGELCLQLVYLTTIQFLKPCKLMLQSIILNRYILILMQ